MRRGGTGDQRDPHATIDAWLIDGASDELPRDVAVHASVCPDCKVRIAAFDILTAVRLEAAGFPPLRTEPIQRGRRIAPVAVAAGGVVTLSAAAAVAAIAAGWRPSFDGIAGASERPTQEVLGNTGQPTPMTASPSSTHSPSATPSASPTPKPAATPPPNYPATARPPTATARASQPSSATSHPTASPTPTAAVTASPTSTPEPATPTPQPPTPTPEATPTP